jgi:flagellar biosynthesis protein FlhF
MHLKRFRGETVRDALAQARHELGPDALVLSTQMVPAAGLRGLTGAREVEIAVGAERMVSELRPARQEVRPPARPCGLAARLEAAGFDSAVAADISAAAGRSGRRRTSGDAVRAAVAQWVTPFVAADTKYAAIEVFIGPPGVGKTTTVAKIAAQERAREGARLALVSADGFRVGAVEQLRLYADIIGAPFVAARTATELDLALMETRSPVLVDTAGRSPRDGAAAEVFNVLRAAKGVRTHLVIPAGSSAKEIARLIALHAEAKPDRLVLTKIDESESAGAVASVLRSSGLRVSYLGNGQRVPEDLVRATPAHVAAALLGDGLTERAA